MNKVRFSNHAVQRFRERFQHIIAEYDGNKILALARSYYASTINNSIKNDTMFMTHLYENHGYDDIQISSNNDMVFVVKEDTLVTVLPSECYIGQRMSSNSSFRK